MYMDGSWYKLTVKDGVVPEDVVGCLDVSVLQENVLAPMLGIGDPRTDKRRWYSRTVRAGTIGRRRKEGSIFHVSDIDHGVIRYRRCRQTDATEVNMV